MLHLSFSFHSIDYFFFSPFSSNFFPLLVGPNKSHWRVSLPHTCWEILWSLILFIFFVLTWHEWWQRMIDQILLCLTPRCIKKEVTRMDWKLFYPICVHCYSCNTGFFFPFWKLIYDWFFSPTPLTYKGLLDYFFFRSLVEFFYLLVFEIWHFVDKLRTRTNLNVWNTLDDCLKSRCCLCQWYYMFKKLEFIYKK